MGMPNIKPHWSKSVFRRNGVKQKDLAQSIGANQSSLSQWLNGRVRMPKEVEEALNRWAKKLTYLEGKK